MIEKIIVKYCGSSCSDDLSNYMTRLKERTEHLPHIEVQRTSCLRRCPVSGFGGKSIDVYVLENGKEKKLKSYNQNTYATAKVQSEKLPSSPLVLVGKLISDWRDRTNTYYHQAMVDGNLNMYPQLLE